jgi:hypothetical protein
MCQDLIVDHMEVLLVHYSGHRARQLTWIFSISVIWVGLDRVGEALFGSDKGGDTISIRFGFIHGYLGWRSHMIYIVKNIVN